MTEYVQKDCQKCGKYRKFLTGTDRDATNICGNCWDWKANP